MTVAVIILLSAEVPGVKLFITKSPPVRVRRIVSETVTEALAEEEVDSAWAGEVPIIVMIVIINVENRRKEAFSKILLKSILLF